MIYSIGDSIISPLAMTSRGNFEAVLRGESRLQYYEHAFGLPEPCFISLFEEERLNNTFSALVDFGIEGYTKMEKAAIVAASQAIEEANIAADRDNVIFILSTTKGNVDLLEHNPYEPERPYLWRSAQIIAEFFDNPNTPIVVSNACISGCAAQIAAANQLRFGGYKYAVVIGAETLSKFIISGFQSFKALSKERCMPFDANRKGLNLGEAAAAIVYTIGDESTTLPDDTLILRAGAINNDANHISGPSRTGEGLLRAINRVLQGHDPAQIAFLNAHGTATPYNDDMESVAITRANLQDTPVNSLKGYFGHTLGAAGVLETIMAHQAVKKHTVIGTLGTVNPGTVNKVNVTLQNQPTNGNAFMKLISGFGGSNAALLLENSNKSTIPAVETHNYASLQPQSTRRASLSCVSSCHITNDNVVADGETLITRREQCGNWLSDIYHAIGMQYPKFFKMDNLCKAGTLAAEILLRNVDFDREAVKPDWAVVLMNSASSLDDDRHYQTTIQDADNYYPSPAVFVYTLANIVTGEIAIRHKLGGESSFYVFTTFSEESVQQIVRQTFDANPEFTHILCGWVDYDAGNCDVRMRLYKVG
ncbi:MAG: 3-oxoacyl-ACP synthase [Bacteroidales bacterium]|nr:3-oxoacyl-ACP synthase [Bacteroidales bacterium]